jgi:hypothetical protein
MYVLHSVLSVSSPFLHLYDVEGDIGCVVLSICAIQNCYCDEVPVHTAFMCYDWIDFYIYKYVMKEAVISSWLLFIIYGSISYGQMFLFAVAVCYIW